MRRLLALCTLLAAVAAATAAATTAAAPAASGTPTAFVLAGGGWGHGVGMSQWGAFGQAKAGRGFEQILATYYRGTEFGSAPAALLDRVRVLVADGLPAAAVTNVIAVFDGIGKRYPVPAGKVTIGPDLKLPVGKDGKRIPLSGPLTLRTAEDTYLTYRGKDFRGDLRVSGVGGRIQLVNVVGLEDYLLGVVPGEMPKDWPIEALKAQAVAARTYAVGHVVKGKGFDLYSDWRSQVYYGVGAEAPGPSRAVVETRGRILTFDGAPAQTLYFSSSGGRTISSLDAFGSDVPYLVSVEDPWDVSSPNHAWPPQLLTGAQLAKRFSLAGTVTDVTYVPGAPGKPAVIRLTTATGVADVRLSAVRTRLGLKSTGFRLGVLRLDRPSRQGGADGFVRLTGVARDLTDVVLEQRGPAGTWSTVKRLAPAANGAFVVKLRPTGTTVYRLSADGLAGLPLTVRVAA
jgi:SpoIID/LytB domain protein